LHRSIVVPVFLRYMTTHEKLDSLALPIRSDSRGVDYAALPY